MNRLKNIAGRIWAAWGAFVFVSSMIIFLIPFFAFCYFLPEPKKTHRFISISRVWMSVFRGLVGCPLTIRNRKLFVPGETYIVISNHNSFFDVPISSPGIPGGNKTIAKAELGRIPVFGAVYKTGSILVDRKSEKSRRDSFLKMKEVLDMGLHMCIYPEGTRNTSDQPLKPFHDGAFRLALMTGRAIMPMIIFNTREVNPSTKGFFLRPKRVYMHFLPPVAATAGETLESLKGRIFRTMSEYYSVNAPALA